MAGVLERVKQPEFQSSPLPTDHIRFVTWTTRYNHCFWITVDGMEKQYERAEVDAERTNDGRDVTVKTANVSRLIVDGGQTFTLDGRKFAKRIQLGAASVREAGR